MNEQRFHQRKRIETKTEQCEPSLRFRLKGVQRLPSFVFAFAITVLTVSYYASCAEQVADFPQSILF